MTAIGNDIRPQMVALLPRLRRFAQAFCQSRDETDAINQATREKAMSRRDRFKLSPGDERLLIGNRWQK